MTSETTEMAKSRITLPTAQLAEFCRRNRVRWLSLSGSVLRDDFRPDSDVDVLVEFESDAHWSLFDLVSMQNELEKLIGREVDLVERAGVVQLVEHLLAKEKVVGSSPIARSGYRDEVACRKASSVSAIGDLL